jgi:hypothetical protein
MLSGREPGPPRWEASDQPPELRHSLKTVILNAIIWSCISVAQYIRLGYANNQKYSLLLWTYSNIIITYLFILLEVNRRPENLCRLHCAVRWAETWRYASFQIQSWQELILKCELKMQDKCIPSPCFVLVASLDNNTGEVIILFACCNLSKCWGQLRGRHLKLPKKHASFWFGLETWWLSHVWCITLA